MFSEIKDKMKSDEGAMGSVETILLIGLSVFAVMIILKYIMDPLQKSSERIGSKIEDMGRE